jgi:hypothetical protein
VDFALISSFIAQKILKKLKAENIREVLYVHPEYINKDVSVFNFKAHNRRVFGGLLRDHAAALSLTFSEKIVAAAPKRSAPSSVANGLIFLGKRMLKPAVLFFKFSKMHRPLIANGKKILFMHAGSPDVDVPIREALRSGSVVLALERGEVVDETSFFRRKIPIRFDVGPLDENVEAECLSTANALVADSGIGAWLTSQGGSEVARAVLPFLKGFVACDVPKILRKAFVFRAFINEQDVSCVCARANTDRESQGPLIAAKFMTEAKAICFEHASFAARQDVYGVFDTITYDRTVARDPVSESLIRNVLSNGLLPTCEVTRSMHYLDYVRRQIPHRVTSREKETIVYVEKKFADRVRCFNNMIDPMTWYFEFQKLLIDFFAGQTDFRFIYKHAGPHGQDWAKRSILPYIRDKKAANISVCSESFVRVLRKADRVVLDYPAGALFEAAVAGKPVLCLYADHTTVIHKAQRIFGKFLRPFASSQEALTILKDFLVSDPDNYRENFPLDQGDRVRAAMGALRGDRL